MRLLNKIGLIGILGLSSLVGGSYSTSAYAKDAEERQPKIVKSYEKAVKTEINKLTSQKPDERNDLRKSLQNRIRAEDKLENAINLAYTQINALEEFAKAEKLPLDQDYFKEQKEFLKNIDASAREVQLQELTPFRECETPVFNIYGKSRQALKERELEKQEIKTPNGYKLIPEDFFDKGTEEKEVKTIIGWLKENSPSFLQGQVFEFTEQCWLSERPYSNPVFLKDFYIMERPVTNKEMKEFFDSDFAKKKGLKPFYKEDAKEYLNNLGLKKDDIEREFEHSKKGMWNKESKSFPEGQGDLISLFNDLEITQAYAEWKGARLATEEEFEKANRGLDNRVYPWGNKFQAYHTNVRKLDIGATVSIQDVNLLEDTKYKSTFGVKFGGLFGCLVKKNNENTSTINKNMVVIKGWKGRNYTGYSGNPGFRQRISGRNERVDDKLGRGWTIVLVKDVPKIEKPKVVKETGMKEIK